MTNSGADGLTRLSELVEWQRQELSRGHAGAAARAVTDMAIGILMERLGSPAAEAEEQLTGLAADAHVAIADLASEITGTAPPGITAHAVSTGHTAKDTATRAWVLLRMAPHAARIARALLRESLADEDVTAVAIWLIAPEGGLDLGGEEGFGSQEAARWRHVPPGFDIPAARAARDDTESWWPHGRPAGADTRLIGGQYGTARAVLPLDSAGISIGAIELCWSHAIEQYSAPLRRKLRGLARVCGQALAAGGGSGMAADYSTAWIRGLLASLHDCALIARPTRGDDGPAGLAIEWVSPRFTDPAGRPPADILGHPLLEIYPEAARPEGLYDRALQVIRTGQSQRVPDAALTAAGELTTDVRIAALSDGVVICWRPGGEPNRLAPLLELAQRLGQLGCWQEDIRTGEVLWTDHAFGLLGRPRGRPVRLQDMDEYVAAQDSPDLLAFRDRLIRQGKTSTAAFRMTRAEDGSVRQFRALAEPVNGPDGDVLAVRGAYQDVSSRLGTQIAFDATREQLTAAEQRATEERQLAFTLQQAITPQASQLVGSAGLAVAARYRPAGAASLVCGDWYDAVVLPDKQVLLAVGDVAGHGLDAVTGMVALRNYLRGLAVTGAGPARLLGWLNSAACQIADGVFATAVCALYDPVSRGLRWARAGHLPPLLVRDRAARSLSPPAGMVLGADAGARYSEAAENLQFGDVLLIFTDGLVESRAVPLDYSLAQIRERAGGVVTDVGGLADEILASSTADTGDDACLLAVTIQ